jgi:hypothetical protein
MTATETNERTQEFQNVTLYISGMFGINATACKSLKITTGVHYAQYTDAIRVEYFERGKRNGRRLMLDYKPWLRVVETKDAINPADALVDNGDGSKMSRYASFDPRYVTDFEDGLIAKAVPVILAIGEGDREKCMRCTTRVATTHEGGSHVCPVCAGAIRQEQGNA